VPHRRVVARHREQGDCRDEKGHGREQREEQRFDARALEIGLDDRAERLDAQRRVFSPYAVDVEDDEREVVGGKRVRW